jgi:hypothetical protein
MGDYVDFDWNKYYLDLKRKLFAEMKKFKTDIKASLLAHIGAIQFREVDPKAKAAIVSSIDIATEQTVNSVVQSIKVGGGPQSFVAVYYEYGTGEKMQPPSGAVPYDGWNSGRPASVGAPIYQRPYGEWFDQGGNRHFSKTKGVPRILPDKKGKIGERIEPHFFFRDSLKAELPKLDGYISNAVKSVPIGAYIRIRSIRK